MTEPSRVVPVSDAPVGRFRAVSVRDAAAYSRDGQHVFAIRWLDDSTCEVLFADGIWMLAGPDDLDESV